MGYKTRVLKNGLYGYATKPSIWKRAGGGGVPRGGAVLAQWRR